MIIHSPRVFKEVSNLIVELVLDLIHLSHNSHGAERRLLANVGVGRCHPDRVWRGEPGGKKASIFLGLLKIGCQKNYELSSFPKKNMLFMANLDLYLDDFDFHHFQTHPFQGNKMKIPTACYSSHSPWLQWLPSHSSRYVCSHGYYRKL